MAKKAKSSGKRRLIIGIAFFCAALLALLWYEYLQAKSGDDLTSSYYAYHLGLLGVVDLEGCKITVTEPWLPRRLTFENLKVDGGEAIFIDVLEDVPKGKRREFSVIFNPDSLRDESLLPAEKIGSHIVRFARPEITGPQIPALGWLPEKKLYVAGKNAAIVRDGIAALSATCPK